MKNLMFKGMNRFLLLGMGMSFMFIVISCTKKSDMPTVNKMEIKEQWRFRQEDKDEWMDARVPGCIHTDLLRQGKIEDPFYRLNEHDVQWIDKKDWVYQTNINITSEWLNKDRIEIDFEGLDTHADVYLNSEKILLADNMFRAWTVDVKEYLKIGDNDLMIHFHSPVQIGLEKYDNYPHIVHSSENDLAEIGQVPGNKWVSPHLRKAHYHFGWDWGPRLVTSGIWKPVFLKAWNSIRIKDLRIVQNRIGKDVAKLTAEFEIEAEENRDANLQLDVDGATVIVPVKIEKGVKIYSANFEIAHPKLWWSNGLGEAHLYPIRGKVATEEGYDEATCNIGLRTLELVREKDQEGKSFFVKLNGHAVFMKGANYVPADAFLDRVSPEKYEKIILTAKECNHNMLRVWGGGIYEKDIFYDLCDKHGMLVWQDFMFACNMYPGHPEFLKSIKEEAEYNIKRLRNHPCLALWCGNNEVLAAWKAWGWEEEDAQRDPKGAKAEWQAYKDIFLDVLPNAVKKLDPQRFYHPSSSQSNDSLVNVYNLGDNHYWGVWWGKDEFSKYHTELSRFMSEYGFQSFPEMNTIKRYTEHKDWDIYSEVMKSHQRSSIGNETIEQYMKRDYRQPKDFASFIYVAQVLQAEGMKMGMEGHRIAMPYNMGSLYWQINDCWPVASWSSFDYYGNWKAMQYFSKKAFAEVLVAPRVEGDSLKMYVVSDRLKPFEAQLEIKLFDFNQKLLWKESMPLTVAANRSNSYWSKSVNHLLNGFNRKEIVLQVFIQEGEKELAKNNYYFSRIKDLNLPKAHVSFEITKGDSEYTIELSTDVIAKNVFLYCEEAKGFFSDNYFDLFPGQKKIITYTPEESIVGFEDELKYLTIRDTY